MPVNTSVRLDTEPMSAILARVAYRLIQREYQKHAHYDVEPTALYHRLGQHLMGTGFPAMAVWVAAFAHYYRKGVSAAAYKQRVVRRSRWARLNREAGKPWARVPGE